jgi:flagellar biosynthesis/type III secretory pathway chaperone
MLEALLHEELTAIEALRELLRREYEALRSRDASSLERLAGEKQVCADGLRGLETRRLEFLRERGLATESPGWAAVLAAASGEGGVLTDLVVELERATQQARSQNDINGAIIAASRSHVERALAILSGRDPLDFLYDQDTRKVFGGDAAPIATA